MSLWLLLIVQLGVTIVTFALVSDGLTLMPPVTEILPPAAETPHHTFYNITPEGVVLKSENVVNENGAGNSSLVIPLLPPVTVLDNILRPPAQTGTKLEDEGQAPPPLPTVMMTVDGLQVVHEAAEKLMNFVKSIETQITEQGGHLNETVEEFNRRIEKGSNGIQTFITKVQEMKSMNLQDLIKKISSDSSSLLDRIRNGLEALGQGFKELTQSIFENDDEKTQNLNNKQVADNVQLVTDMSMLSLNETVA